MMETRYYHMKGKIVELATAFVQADEETRDALRREADFFPISQSPEDSADFKAMLIRIRGELFFVEDTPGGEVGVFAVLQPVM